MRNSKPDGRPYKRDAFIYYNSNDRAWVCGDLHQRLQESHVSTTMHHHDFLSGSVLEEMIRESIDVCRYTVLVLSPDFLSSNWFLLEIHQPSGTSERRQSAESTPRYMRRTTAGAIPSLDYPPSVIVPAVT
ncbi:hypothetical protein LSAT2_017025 [Lamellibrachia satsuma]|nr:hypothetical protein LSAT2_017025 [Lamellibrachia satsuma]